MKYSFIRFLLVGAMNTVIGLSVMYTLLDIVHLNYWFATFGGNAVGAVVSYILNKRFTFNSHVPVVKSSVAFIVVISVCYVFSYSLGRQAAWWFLQRVTHLPKLYSDNIAILFGSVLYTVTNYFGQKYVVFNNRPKSKIEVQ